MVEQPLGGLREPSETMGRLLSMELIWLFIGAVILAGALFAFSGRFEGWGKPQRFTDKDADGEPDEPDGPAKDL